MSLNQIDFHGRLLLGHYRSVGWGCEVRIKRRGMYIFTKQGWTERPYEYTTKEWAMWKSKRELFSALKKKSFSIFL